MAESPRSTSGKQVSVDRRDPLQPGKSLRARFPDARRLQDYRRASATIDALVGEIGEDESHPLAELLDLLASQTEAWEAHRLSLPRDEPREVLRRLMQQDDLADCAPLSRISEILNGRRAISKNVAKALPRLFAVPVGVFP